MTEPVVDTADLPSGVWPCTHCKAPVVIRMVRDRRRWPFDRALLPAEEVPEYLRYVPVPSGHGVVMVPAADMSPRRIEGIRWYAQRHTCAAWLRWFRDKRTAEQAARDDEVGSIADALAEVLGLSVDRPNR